MGCEIIDLGDGAMFLCSRWGGATTPPKCHYCSRPSSKLCDWPTEVAPVGKYPATCDRPLCGECVVVAGPNQDHCRIHKETKMTTTLVPYRDKPKEIGMPESGLFLLIGDVKAGKTTFAASFPDSYVLELEPKRGDRIKRGRIDDTITNLDQYGDVLEAALADDSIKTIVIDTVDVIAKWLQARIAGPTRVFGAPEKGVDTYEDWREFEADVRGMVDYLKQSGKLIILVAHRRMAKVDKDDHVVKPAGINVQGQGGDYIAQQAEMVGFMGVRVLGGKSVVYLTFKGESDRCIWRSGIDELRDKEVVLPESDPFGAFAALFQKAAPKPAPTLKPAPKAETKKKR